MKTFNGPIIYRSPLISGIKAKRRQQDKMKKDFSPTLLDFGPLQIFVARHFGFCYGVENAIDIAFRTVEENPGKRIFLLSEMIHNAQVNEDLRHRGVRFLQDTSGNQLVSFDDLNPDDVVITPAFGTTLEIERRLLLAGILIEKYNTTCPFVEKVWNRSGQIASKEYTVVVHGKPSHEETRATFSHAASVTATVIVRDMAQAQELAQFIRGDRPANEFYTSFDQQYSPGFRADQDLQRIGVVNQTTMLANDTQAIADFLKRTILDHYGVPEERAQERFADTRDTLCYATLDNQSAVYGMLETAADLAVVVGGYNSSNTSHLVELCAHKLPTYFISSHQKMLSSQEILHYLPDQRTEIRTSAYLPTASPARILITSGASCPDVLVEEIIEKLAGYYPTAKSMEEMLQLFPS